MWATDQDHVPVKMEVYQLFIGTAGQSHSLL